MCSETSMEQHHGLGEDEAWEGTHLVSPYKPERIRPQSARPQSHRFLQETSLKLAHDSLRAHQQRFPAGVPQEEASTVSPTTPDASLFSSPSPSPPPLPSSPSPPLPLPRGSPPQLYQSDSFISKCFLPEASECVRSLQVIFDSANASDFASNFEEWSRNDLRGGGQMKVFVSALNSLNQSMDDFLTRCLPPEDLKDFQGSSVALAQGVKELKALQHKLSRGVEDFGQQVVSCALAVWKPTSEAALVQLHKKLDRQLEQQHSASTEQNNMKNKLDHIEAKMEGMLQRLDEIVKHARLPEDLERTIRAACGSMSDQQGCISAKQLDIEKKLDVMRCVTESFSEAEAKNAEYLENLSSSQHTMNHICSKSMELQKQLHDGLSARSPWWQEKFKEQLTTRIAAENECLKRYMDEVLGIGSGQTSVAHILSSLERKISSLETSSLEDSNGLRNEVDRLKASLRDSTDQLAMVRVSRDSALEEKLALESNVKELHGELQQAQGELEVAKCEKMVCSLKRLQDIEKRGNVKVNRQTGQVTLLKDIPFLPAAPPAKGALESIAFASVDEAHALISDLAEILKIFDMAVKLSVTCKVPRGGAKEAWRDYASLRAEFIKEQLENGGVLSGRVSASGAVAGANEIVFDFDASYFASKQAAKRGARSKSPQRR